MVENDHFMRYELKICRIKFSHSLIRSNFLLQFHTTTNRMSKRNSRNRNFCSGCISASLLLGGKPHGPLHWRPLRYSRQLLRPSFFIQNHVPTDICTAFRSSHSQHAMEVWKRIFNRRPHQTLDVHVARPSRPRQINPQSETIEFQRNRLLR